MKSPKPPKVKKTKSASSGSGVSLAVLWTPRARLLAVLVIAVVIGCVHFWWSRYLLEALRWWSTRSTLQKETSLYSEQSMYYRYYKNAVHARSFSQLWRSFTQDEGIQYPDVINALQRYNVYPEFFLALIYRTGWTSYKEPIDFYADAVHFVNGFFLAAIFLTGTLLSKNILGGLLSCVVFAFNYTHSTRSYWSFPLREAFGNPFWFSQVAVLTVFLYSKSTKNASMPSERTLFALFAFTTWGFAISWQFAPFTLFTQVIALFLLYALEGISRMDLRNLLLVEISTIFIVGLVFQFGNAFTLNSVFLSTAVVALVMTQVVPFSKLFLPNSFFNPAQAESGGSDRTVKSLKRAMWLVVKFARIALALIVLMVLSLALKTDDHIFDIMRAKFTSYHDFHTRMYLKQKEYLALHNDPDTVGSVIASGIAPTMAVVATVIFLAILLGKQLNSELTYNWLQYMAATLKAGLIMRLKLFWMPYNAILASVLLSPESFGLMDALFGLMRIPQTKRKWITVALIVAVVAYMASYGVPRLVNLYYDEKEWDHEDLQAVLSWITKNTPPNAVFSTDMGHASHIVLSTGRRVTNHPHYESEDIRNRTELVYRMFECDSVKEVHENLTALGTDYVLVFHLACRDNRLRDNSCPLHNRACSRMKTDPSASKYFKSVYTSQGGKYIIYQVQ